MARSKHPARWTNPYPDSLPKGFPSCSQKEKLAQLIPPYKPTVSEVLKVKKMLMQRGVALEIVGIILDHAQYWPHSATWSECPEARYYRWRFTTRPIDMYTIKGGCSQLDKDSCVIRTHPVRAIVCRFVPQSVAQTIKLMESGEYRENSAPTTKWVNVTTNRLCKHHSPDTRGRSLDTGVSNTAPPTALEKELGIRWNETQTEVHRPINSGVCSPRAVSQYYPSWDENNLDTVAWVREDIQFPDFEQIVTKSYNTIFANTVVDHVVQARLGNLMVEQLRWGDRFDVRASACVADEPQFSEWTKGSFCVEIYVAI